MGATDLLQHADRKHEAFRAASGRALLGCEVTTRHLPQNLADTQHAFLAVVWFVDSTNYS